ncbi:hypothetical protein Pint_08076 [Pistacia integerrima]|uniref:Uncharacterized protein n=1 Tax=Pistacia integerrima TaxID=434235 RepID=A0ACC0XZD4_9ROSI|nr:hypothetical protein Pint_08076 [Pistacia integerrima]
MDQLKPSLVNSCPLTPVTFLPRAATVYGDYPSLVYNTTTYTWTQTYRRCLQLASSLSSLGIKTGHVVSVVAPNIPPMYELHFAVPMSGAILNTINTRLDARTVSSILQHSESKLVFVDHIFSSLILEAVSLFPPNTETPRLVLVNDEDTSASTLIGFIDTYENMVKNGNSEFKWIEPTSEWDPMVLNYTSGTTSSPKSVVLSHKGLFIATINSLIDWSVSNQPVYLWTLPMFHGNGWCYTWGMAAVGATNICLRKIDVSTIYTLIKKHKVTYMCGAPVVLNMLSNNRNAERIEHPVHILTGGAPPPAPVLFRIWSYLKDPKTTSKCMKDNGWFYTGDVAVMHPDGYVEIKDRSKDVIISGGENISSAQVESVLYSHPMINEAAVVARPDPFWQETPCAFVCLKNDFLASELTEKEIIDF